MLCFLNINNKKPLLTMKKITQSSVSLWTTLLSSLIMLGCVTIYKPIVLEKLEMNDGTFRFPESNVEVSVKYKVLENAYRTLRPRCEGQ